MTKNEALKMAYDWLNEYAPPEVVQACKEALEQPTLTYEDGFAHGYEAHRAEQALEQPAQEPVAVITPDNYGEPRLDFIVTFKYKATTAVNPDIFLYTHPAPSWQELSDDEIDRLYADWERGQTDYLNYTRAIEEALKEKNT